MTIVNYAMIALFAFSAIVQLNDPDPVAWLLVYLGAMAFCILWIMDAFPRTLGFVFAAATLVTGLLLVFRAMEHGFFLWDEYFNEAAGMIVVFLWTSSLAWLDWRRHGEAPLT